MELEILKRTKHAVELKIGGQEYTLNKFGVFCKKTLQDDGRYWYSYAGFLSKDEREMREPLVVSKRVYKEYPKSSECPFGWTEYEYTYT